MRSRAIIHIEIWIELLHRGAIVMKDEKSIDRIIQVQDVNIGENIKCYRERAKLKQTDIVKKLQLIGLDISIYSYNRIEKGTQNPTVSFLLAVCSLLDCDMNDLFGVNNNM